MPAISLGFLFRFLWWFILALINIGLIFLAGHVINRKLLRGAARQSLVWQAVYAWASGAAFFILFGILLLFFKLYSPIAWNVVSILVLITAFLVYYRHRHFLSRLSWQEIKYFFSHSRALEKQNRFSLLTVVAVVFLFIAFLQLFSPPSFRDEIAYHLFIPRLWEYQHHFWMAADNFHLLFPANMEILWGYALAQGGVHMPRFITFIFGLLALLGMRQAFSEWKMNREIIKISMFFLLITPIALIGLVTCSVEWPLFFFLFLGWHAAKRFLKTMASRDLLFATICWGCALGIKYTALPIVGFLLLGLCWRLRQARLQEGVLRAILFMLLSAMIFLGPWAMRNYLIMGNPFHPLTITNVFASPSGHDDREVATLTSYAGLRGSWKLNPWLFHATFEKKVDEKMHIGWPVLLVLVLFSGWRWRKELPWHMLVGLTMLFFYFSPSARIYFPLMGFCFLFLPVLVNEIFDWIWLRVLLKTILLVYALPCFAAIVCYFFLTSNRADQDYFLGIKDDAAYLQAAGAVTPLHLFIQERLPRESRFWAWCEDEGFYFERWVLPTSPYGTPAFLKIFKRGGEKALDDKIMQNKIDYLVINTEKCNIQNRIIRLDKTIIAIDEEEGQRLISWMKRNLIPMKKDHRFELYQVIPR